MIGIIHVMVFQILVGIWMLISPFVFGYSEMTGLTTSSMIFGAVVALLGLGVAFYRKNLCRVEQEGKKRT